MTALVSKMILTAFGAGIVVAILARLFPNEKLRAMGRAAGKTLSAFGCRKLGRGFWERVENFLENSFTVLADGFKEGLDEDDNIPVVGPGPYSGEPGGPITPEKRTETTLPGPETPQQGVGQPPSPPPELSGRPRHQV